MSLGKNLEKKLKEKNLSLNQLSDLSGVPYHTLYATIKRNSKTMEIDSLQKIADAFQISITDLLRPDDWETNSKYKDDLKQMIDHFNNSYDDVLYNLGFYVKKSDDGNYNIKRDKKEVTLSEVEYENLKEQVNDYIRFLYGRLYED